MDRDQIWDEFTELSKTPDDQVDLAWIALLISNGMNPDLDPNADLLHLDSMAEVAKKRIGNTSDPLSSLNRLSEFLFDDLGFEGNQDDYYNPDNSFLDRVLTTRLGIPISLSLLYIEVGRRLGIPLIGVGMPGHFLVKHEALDDLYVDAFSRGILLSTDECKERLKQVASEKIGWNSSYLQPIGKKAVIARMLGNLKAAYLHQEEHQGVLSILDLLLCIKPDADIELRDRGLVNYRLGRFNEALFDLKGYVARDHKGPDVPAVEELVGRIMRKMRSGGD